MFDLDDLVLYRPAEPIAGVRPIFVLPNQEMADYFGSCAGGLPEAPLIEWATTLLPEPSTFIDVGSHVGTWSAVFAGQRWEGSAHQVDSFEANPYLWHLLDATAMLNHAASFNWRRTRAGAGETFRSVTLSAPYADGGGASAVRSFPTPAFTADTTLRPLDESLFYFDKIGLIKIDVEGAELDVLRGARKTIAASQPKILFECWQTDERREDLFRYLHDSLGYVTSETTWPEMFLGTPKAS